MNSMPTRSKLMRGRERIATEAAAPRTRRVADQQIAKLTLAACMRQGSAAAHARMRLVAEDRRLGLGKVGCGNDPPTPHLVAASIVGSCEKRAAGRREKLRLDEARKESDEQAHQGAAFACVGGLDRCLDRRAGGN